MRPCVDLHVSGVGNPAWAPATGGDKSVSYPIVKDVPQDVVDWFHFLRDVCCQWVDSNAYQIGGLDENCEPKIVEIDESCFYRRKNHVGEMGPHQWVFVGIECATRKCFLIAVPDRSRHTLLPHVQQWIGAVHKRRHGPGGGFGLL